MDKKEKELRLQIKKIVQEIFKIKKQEDSEFIPGKSFIQYAGSVFDDKEVNNVISTWLDGWFGLGQFAEDFERGLAKYIGATGSIITNSGSSSNLLSVASLMSPMFPERLHPGDEVITLACGFPTTVNPIIQLGLVPVFMDVNLGTYSIKIEDLQHATSSKTKAVFLAHTLGNPHDMDLLVNFCKEKGLFLIEDNCDALGSIYKGKKTGSFGILSTQSFYPPHHLTMGEGGAVNYNDRIFERITRSLRDWGRACWCRGDEKGRYGACNARFNYKIGGKPYDHKYIFSQIGYNLKPIEPQAAMGVIQLKRLNEFTRIRRKNFARFAYHAKEGRWERFFVLPKATTGAKPSWFAYPLTIKDDAKFDRLEITRFLEENKIQTRTLFGGNLTKQPAYRGINMRIVGNLENSDRILYNTFFLGVYPKLDNRHIDYMAGKINEFLKRF
ncbi:lipopolysaccharide biosynthesis protein RfbH [Candidatus Parcubacteria bacterium]|nr:lipopolysaccharide biosynthesis protein RfbH [Patescibacteria group bacterium]MCG2689519.1 lipopolysaccharide biosynthesis protein RfbH [Candidatus Parcubacteria bacterium]